MYSQNTDSLKQILKITKNDTLRIHLLKTIGEEEAIFRIGYWDSLRVECETKLVNCENSKKQFFLKSLSVAINNIGYVADEQGNMDLALESYLKSMKLFAEIKDQMGLAKALNNIGSVYEDLGDIAKALEYYHKSLKIREEIKDEKGVAVCFNNIGLIYFKQKDFDKALKYYHSALSLLTKLNHRQLIAISYNNIGLVYKSKNNFTYALYYFQKARAIQLSIGDDFNVIQSTNNLAGLYEDQEKYSEALKLYEENQVLSDTLNYKKGTAVSLVNIAEVYFKTGKQKEALAKAKSGLILFQELGFPEHVSKTSALLSRIYESMGNYKEAYFMQVLHKKMNDSLNNIENRKASIQKEFQYAYEKKAATDSLKIATERKELALKAKQEKMQRYYLYFGLAGLLVFSLIIANRLKVSRRQNVIIENQKLEVELKNEEITQQKELVDEKQKEIIDSINYAKRIQQAVLTGEDVWNKISKEHFILFKPKDIVSGDFYWAYNTPNNRSVFALADCTGHGVPGGFMSMLGNSFLNEIVVENKIFKANEILNKLRAKIIHALEQKGQAEQKDGMDISLCVWNKIDNTLEFSGANNPLWIVKNSVSSNGVENKELLEYKADKMPIGTFLETEVPFSSVTIQLQKGYTIYLTTDGYADQFGGEKGKKFKYKPLIEMIIRNSGESMETQKLKLETAHNTWKAEHDQVDDVSIIGIRI